MNEQHTTLYICDPRKAYNCKKNVCIYNVSSPLPICPFTKNINYAARDTITGLPKKVEEDDKGAKND